MWQNRDLLRVTIAAQHSNAEISHSLLQAPIPSLFPMAACIFHPSHPLSSPGPAGGFLLSGAQNNSSMVQWNNEASMGNRSALGFPPPLSHLATACWLTLTASATCCWDNPIVSRNTLMLCNVTTSSRLTTFCCVLNIILFFVVVNSDFRFFYCAIQFYVVF